MAEVWSRSIGECHYEVRTAGKSVRLYTNGVFHSQWNPNRLLGDAIWDLQVLAGFQLVAALGEPGKPGKSGEQSPLRVLVLGVGGGAVIRQLLGLFAIESIHGIDLDKTHLAIAKRWFGLSACRQVTLVAANAIDWVHSYRGPKFHLVIDDLFGHNDAEVSRSVAFTDKWASGLNAIVENKGALVVNTAGKVEFGEVCLQVQAEATSSGEQALGIKLVHPRYENRILVNLKNPSMDSPAAWRQSWVSGVERQLAGLAIPSSHRSGVKRLALQHLQRARKTYYR